MLVILLGIIKQLCICGNSNVQRMCQATHLPGKLHSLPNKWLTDGVADVRREEDLWVSVQGSDDILGRNTTVSCHAASNTHITKSYCDTTNKATQTRDSFSNHVNKEYNTKLH